MREFVATVTVRGQVTIPAEVRRRMGLNGSDKVAFVVDDADRVLLRPARHTLASVKGIVPPPPGWETADVDNLINEAMEDEAARAVRGWVRR